ncbi:Frag1/DRAM/Sfk1 family-domain-containing protein [Coniella lustricola]|uniref:Frag1/DRAM/Sfk1 family-domain-containing protein n=1 Tax=Coniella lustricola TaxID=2025994 RepID=A0A2T3A2Q7_9PEZI|nr:Frag1/DRAM/Sfk1 family-domain-containing protein [Coniella lustricola]
MLVPTRRLSLVRLNRYSGGHPSSLEAQSQSGDRIMAGIWLRIFGKDVRYSHRLWLFPLVAGLAWFSTLSILLIRWLAIGQPRYPGQVNPEVPFISDIAAFTFQPVFIVGCAITGVAFAGTVFAVHHVRYSDKFYALTDDAHWRQVTSFWALFAGLVAAACLVLLSVFDTFQNHVEHRYLLMGTFGGLGSSAILTAVVWQDQAWGPANFPGLRKWCLFNNFLVVCQTALGIAFVALLYAGQYRPSGFLEWTLTYLGSFWLGSFVGYTRFREVRRPLASVDHERQPLLASV